MKYFLLLFLLPWNNAYAYSYEKLSVTPDITWASRYVIDGFSVGKNPVVEPSLSIGLPNTEFTLMLWSAIQLHRDEKQEDEYDAFLFYNHDFFAQKTYAINFHSFYDYWFYPNTATLKDDFGDVIAEYQKHGSKVHAGISMTNLFPLAGSFLIPSYNVFYWFYWQQNRLDLYQGGALQQLLFSYTHAIPALFPGSTRPYASAKASVNYQGGAFGVQEGWSHSTASLQTGFDALSSLFEVSLTKQWTFNSSVNTENPLWASFSWSKEF
jgi:hypothetical protein